MQPVKTFRQYLESFNLADSTIDNYINLADAFLTANPDATKYSYKDVLNYITEKLKQKAKPTTVKASLLAAIKKYYDYLIEIGIRNDHPCRTLTLKNKSNKQVIHQDLFSAEELELILEREERYEQQITKNKLISSLLIYQGLTVGEIIRLKVQHIDLDKALIYVKESRYQSRRYLEIQPKQYPLLEKYIREERKKRLKEETDILILGIRGTRIKELEIWRLIDSFKYLFPQRHLTAGTVRQSVISNWLNEKKIPLEQVQLMAGHKWISTTAKYRFTSIDEQRELVNKFHPLSFQR
jgi:integrase/recombinase XerD